MRKSHFTEEQIARVLSEHCRDLLQVFENKGYSDDLTTH